MPHAVVNSRDRNSAKSLRQRMTRAEILLWRYLKAHHIDELGFRRQVPIGKFIADFICHSARLLIELDGETHDFQSRQREDKARDAWFKLQGYRVLRFTNDQVLKNLEGVVKVIRITAQQQKLPPSLSLPHKGGGNAQTEVRRAANPFTQGKRESAATCSEIDT
jgi:very-short-patch-repair endonuclease